MRVGLISYPMLFQRIGGLQRQIVETQAALQGCGEDASFVRVVNENLGDYDIVHVFSAIHGNYSIVKACQDIGLPVVISPVLSLPFRLRDRIVCEVIRRILGRTVGWNVRTTYDDIRVALDGSSHIIALGNREFELLKDGFAQNAEKISIVPNGVTNEFFYATPDLFVERYKPDRPVVLCVGSISENKNQKTAAQVVKNIPAYLYMFGLCSLRAQSYLQEVKQIAPKRVHYFGAVSPDDPVLSSAYKAADVVILPSVSEVMPITVLEALAAGTPVVMTKNHSMGIQPKPGLLEMYDPFDVEGMRSACERIIASPPKYEDVQALVKPYQWSKVAADLVTIYRDLVQK